MSYNLSSVSVYVVDLKKVTPFTDSLAQTTSSLSSSPSSNALHPAGTSNSFRHGQSFRKSFNKERPPGGLRQNEIKMSLEAHESDDKSSTETEDDLINTADIKDLNHYHNIFQPRGRERKRQLSTPFLAFCVSFLVVSLHAWAFCTFLF